MPRLRLVVRDAPPAARTPGESGHRAPPAAALAGPAEVQRHRGIATPNTAEYDPGSAMAEAVAAVPDRRGGTRLGEPLRKFLNRWGRRGMARGAVVVLPAARIRRPHRPAHRVIRANRRKAYPGHMPLAAGMAAALPSMDALVEGHRSAAPERPAAVVRGVDDA